MTTQKGRDTKRPRSSRSSSSAKLCPPSGATEERGGDNIHDRDDKTSCDWYLTAGYHQTAWRTMEKMRWRYTRARAERKQWGAYVGPNQESHGMRFQHCAMAPKCGLLTFECFVMEAINKAIHEVEEATPFTNPMRFVSPRFYCTHNGLRPQKRRGIMCRTGSRVP